MGRPRSERAHQAVLRAAGDLLLEGGMGAVTMEAVAARAQVSKVTIYKWWPSRGAVALDGFFHVVRERLAFPDSGNVVDDLAAQVLALIRLFRETPAGPSLAGLIGQAQSDPRLAAELRQRWLQPRRALAFTVLERAVERGEIDPGADPEMIIDQIYGPIYHRLLFGHEPLADELADVLVRTVILSVTPRPPAAREFGP